MSKSTKHLELCVRDGNLSIVLMAFIARWKFYLNLRIYPPPLLPKDNWVGYESQLNGGIHC